MECISRFVAELMLLKLTYMDSTVSVEQLIKALGDPQAISSKHRKSE